MTDLQWSPAEIAALQAGDVPHIDTSWLKPHPPVVRNVVTVLTPEPYAKQRLVMCCVCNGWCMKGTIASRGCPHCGGAL